MTKTTTNDIEKVVVTHKTEEKYRHKKATAKEKVAPMLPNEPPIKRQKKSE